MCSRAHFQTSSTLAPCANWNTAPEDPCFLRKGLMWHQGATLIMGELDVNHGLFCVQAEGTCTRTHIPRSLSIQIDIVHFPLLANQMFATQHSTIRVGLPFCHGLSVSIRQPRLKLRITKRNSNERN